ncbi:MAG TPA: radical SAM protein [Candidatus Nitrosotenuis sp.]|jgi:DNA repair photolyase|nr:radical SAM protein [Candidatus Nitrosotenuis sp.]
MHVSIARVKKILTRTSGFLATVCSHSLQPYRGCSFGNSLCGAGCYVQHNACLTRGEPWGSFVEVRENAAQAYRAEAPGERAWAHRRGRAFAIFLSSSTEPFMPQERRYRVTRGVLEAMLEEPPDELILQTHSPTVTDYLDLYPDLARRCRLRFHLSVESDRERLPGLPPPASTVEARLQAAATLRQAGLRVVITVSPLLPIARPDSFFARIAECADAVVLDHFVEGDGTCDGSRTRRTALPAAMEATEPGSSRLAYRDRMVEVARRHLPGRVGVNVDGFAGRYLP